MSTYLDLVGLVARRGQIPDDYDRTRNRPEDEETYRDKEEHLHGIRGVLKEEPLLVFLGSRSDNAQHGQENV